MLFIEKMGGHNLKRSLGYAALFTTSLAWLFLARSSASAQGLTYVDANDGFIGTQTLFPSAALNDLEAIEDNRWGYRENFGAEGPGGRFIYESGGVASGVEDAPEIFQTVSGLTPSTSYDLYAVFWSAGGGANWPIRTGITPGNLTLYDRNGTLDGAVAGIEAGSAAWASPPTSGGTPIYTEADRIMYLALAGTVTVDGSGQANVYFDDLPNNTANDRSWIDGIAYVASGSAISLTATIDRNTGLLTLSNGTSSAYDFTGLSITSTSGALDASSWLTITDNYDEGTIGSDPWEVTAPLGTPAFTAALTEVQSAGAAGPSSISASQSLSFGSVWNDTRFEDVTVQLTLAGGTTIALTPTYTGDAHLLGDFDNSGAVDLADYAVFSSNLLTDVSALTQAEAYLRGDMNGDLVVNHSDFISFRNAFPGSLAEALAAVPEPSSGLLASLIAVFAVGRCRRKSNDGSNHLNKPSSPQLLTRVPPMTRPLLFAVLAFTVLLLTTASTYAINVNLTASNGFGSTSFNNAAGWSNGQAPSAGNDYFTGDFILRTPADGGSYTFAGDSLTVNNTNGYPQGLFYKGTGNTGVITIDDLILDGGLISHGNGLGDLFQLDGAITVASTSSIRAKQGNIDILASISGTGGLIIETSDVPGDTSIRLVNLLGNNTYTGDLTVNAGGVLTLGATGSMTFNIGSAGVNNSIAGDGAARFDGAFNFDLTGASATLGDTWQITNVASQSFNDQFNIPGFSNLGDIWFDGTYTFNEATGALSVAPAPERLALRVLSNGQVEIVNGSTIETVDMNYYEIHSSTAVLSTSWTGIDGAVTASDITWEQAGGSTASLIAETNLLGSMSFSPSDSVSIGQAFAGVESDADSLEFLYGVTGSDDLHTGFVEFVTVAGLPGDYNNDGRVNAADYTVWRDGNSPDDTQAGYDLWAANYGATSISEANSTAVPEPASCVAIVLALSLAASKGSRI
ncbi:hypothetical protein Pla108_38300 [Botrimarina colliarenosi]|uniref:Autotransporter-associated beta strand repeat protein n=1 Tax=Botrimarina colliarenosi TaxID=2528001 RepID=A0A5C6A4A4_9BACT|nr:hypothetical protein [Botrimarina colliarenosi]TWT94118.1 hypothetical protein Pla108_38300 [Botrimarina colliarenosi]